MKDIQNSKNKKDVNKNNPFREEETSEMTIRVRYAETDQMGVAWHGNYFAWFEMGRTEHLRERGVTYRHLEESGVRFAIVSAECSYKRPVLYDDVLTLKTRILDVTGVKITHEYRIFRDGELLAIGKTVLASLNKEGKIALIPDWLKKVILGEKKED